MTPDVRRDYLTHTDHEIRTDGSGESSGSDSEWLPTECVLCGHSSETFEEHERHMQETHADPDPFEAYEAKMDELNDGLLEAYAAGFAKALETYNINGPSDKSVAGLQRTSVIREFHHYYWEGRTRPLEFWLREQFGIDTDRDDEPSGTQEGDR